MVDRKEPHLHGNAPDTTPNRTTDTTRDAAYTPTGSARAGVAAPKNNRSGGWLWAALAAVLAILAVVWFVGLGDEEVAEVDPAAPIEGEVVEDDVAVDTAPIVTTDEELIESDQAEVVPLEDGTATTDAAATDVATEATTEETAPAIAPAEDATTVAVDEAPALEGAVAEETIAETAGELETEADAALTGTEPAAADGELIPDGEGTEVEIQPTGN